jgi:hypothetical protein
VTGAPVAVSTQVEDRTAVSVGRVTMMRRWARALILCTILLVLPAIVATACGSSEPADETSAASQESSTAYGGGDTTLSTAASDSEEASPDVAGDEWPSELKGLVPQPQGGSITDLEKIGEFDYLISCSVPGSQALGDYVTLLLSQGFATVTQETTGEFDSTLLQKGDMIVDVSSYSPGQLDLCITDDATYVCPVEDY